jgi:hypothetical protein
VNEGLSSLTSNLQKSKMKPIASTNEYKIPFGCNENFIMCKLNLLKLVDDA